MSTPLSPTTRLALTFAFVTMLVDTIGLGIVIPVTPQIIAQLTGHDPHAADAMSDAEPRQPHLSSRRRAWVGVGARA